MCLIRAVYFYQAQLLLSKAVMWRTYQWWFYVGARGAQAPPNLAQAPKFLILDNWTQYSSATG